MRISELGASIKNRRKEVSITQEHLAELAEVSKNTLYKLERGESNPSLEIVEKILDILGLELTVQVKKMTH
jgi:y4mF family transcriptional regulator